MCPVCGWKVENISSIHILEEKDVSSSLLVFLSLKEEVEMVEPLSNSPKIKVTC